MLNETTISFIPLGGMSAVGAMNCYVLTYGKEALILDCGQKIPFDNSIFHSQEDFPDEYFPNFGPLLKGGFNVRGVCISHSHLDHAGGVPHFYKRYAQTYPDRTMPTVFASRFARSVIENIIYSPVESDLPPPLLPKMESLVWNRSKQIGPFAVRALPIIHSTPGASGFSVKVGGKHILYLGDCKLRGNSGEEHRFRSTMQDMRSDGVDLFLLDSSNAQLEGHAEREGKVLVSIGDVMRARRENRIIIATFSSHLKRIRYIINLARAQGRFVFVLGAGLLRYLRAYELSFPEEERRKRTSGWRAYYEWRNGHNVGVRYSDVPDDAVILVTGAQAEEGSGIFKMLNGDVPLPWDLEKDVIMIAANTIPRPEIQSRVKEMVELAHEHCQTLYLAPSVAAFEEYDNVVRGLFHASGHGMREDLRELTEMVQPRVVIPVHGDREHRETVRSIVSPETGFELVEDGEIFDV